MDTFNLIQAIAVGICLAVGFQHLLIGLQWSGATVDLTGIDLTRLPTEWVTRVREATRRGRRELLFELIDQIKTDNAQVVEGLTKLITELQFRKIITLTKQVEQTSHDSTSF